MEKPQISLTYLSPAPIVPRKGSVIWRVWKALEAMGRPVESSELRKQMERDGEPMTAAALQVQLTGLCSWRMVANAKSVNENGRPVTVWYPIVIGGERLKYTNKDGEAVSPLDVWGESLSNCEPAMLSVSRETGRRPGI